MVIVYMVFQNCWKYDIMMCPCHCFFKGEVHVDSKAVVQNSTSIKMDCVTPYFYWSDNTRE